MIILTIVFFLSPTLNDFITWIGKINVFRYILYFIGVVTLYGSMLLTSLISATLGFLGVKAKFIVTPKNSKKVTLLFALRFQWKELVFAVILLVVSFLIEHSLLPVLLISGTSILSLALLFFSNKTYSSEQKLSIDKETTDVMIQKNPLISGDITLPYLGVIKKRKPNNDRQ